VRALLIAEKPSVAKTVQAAFQPIKGSYPYTVDFTSAAGHLVELSMPDQYTEEWGLPWNVDVLPIIPDNWKKEVISSSSKFYNNIKQLIKDNDYDILINCCDCGREGEHIFYNIYEKLGLSIPVKRMWYDDQTEDELRRSINNLRDSDEFKGYRYASDLREKFDWLIGINFTRTATLKTNQKIVIGRCITVILSMVVKRELAIKNFVPTPFFELEATFVTSDGEFYTGKLVNTAGEGKTNRFDDKAMLESIDFSKPSYKVTKVKKGRIVTKPKSLLNIAALQKECNTQYGYTADKTLKIAQSLYEKKILSYPRTDCRYITTGMVDDFTDLLSSIAVIPELQPHVSGVIGNTSIYDRIKASKDFVNNKKITDHPALTPTKEKPDWGSLSKDEQNVYLTVAKRFLAMFLEPCIYNKVDVTTESSAGDVFITNGKALDSLGWKVLYKPVAYQYDATTGFTLTPLLDEDGAVAVDSVMIKVKNGQEQKKNGKAKTRKALSDYGFGSVVSFKTITTTKTFEGTYEKQDVWDDATCTVVQSPINEPFSTDMGSEEHEVYDSIVTMMGGYKYDYSDKKTLTEPVKSGESANESDNVSKILYETKTVTLYTATNSEGTSVSDKTAEWCSANGYTPIESSAHTATYNLYKYRSATSGIYTNEPSPEGEEDLSTDFTYFYSYIKNFNGYVPVGLGRNYHSFDSFIGIATTEDYKNKSSVSGGNGKTGGVPSYVQAYIDLMAPYALQAQKETGVSAAIIIAQGALESGYGRSGNAKNANNFFGITWTSGCGYECYNGKWRKYDDIADNVRDYCKVIWNSTGNSGFRYREAAGKSYKEAIDIIWEGGYCASGTKEEYVNGVVSIIENNHLAEYENDPEYQWDGTEPEFAKGGNSQEGSGSQNKIKGTLSDEEVDQFTNILNLFLKKQNSNEDVKVTTEYCKTRYDNYSYHPTNDDQKDILLTTVAFNKHLYKDEINIDSITYADVLGSKSGNGDSNGTGDYVGNGEYLWIVPGQTTITSYFGPRNSPTAGASSNHGGIDIACPEGSDVIAAKEGTVIAAHYDSGGGGNYICIEHEGGIQTEYMHNSKLLVKKGDVVKKGQVIAKSGNTGVSTGPHCHFGVKKDGVRVNPLDYVSPTDMPTKTTSFNDKISEDAEQVTGETSETRKKIVSFALKYIGNRYVYGGTSLTNGTDCSGYTLRIYEHFGIKLNRVAQDQTKNCTIIQKSELQPGDLVFFKKPGAVTIHHVAMYIGNGKIAHAASTNLGIITSELSNRSDIFCYGRVKGIEALENKEVKSTTEEETTEESTEDSTGKKNNAKKNNSKKKTSKKKATNKKGK